MTFTKEEREKVIEHIVLDDIKDIKENLVNTGESSYLRDILLGKNYTPLTKLTDDELYDEYRARFLDDYLDGLTTGVELIEYLLTEKRI